MARSLVATRCPAWATGTVVPSARSRRSASRQISASIPEDAKSRSTTMPSSGSAGRAQPYGRESFEGLMFQGEAEPISVRQQIRHKRFRLVVAGDRDSQVDVPGETRLTADRHGQPADQSPWLLLRVKRLSDVPKHGQQARRAGGLGHGSSRGGPSPASAPGRSCNQRFRIASTSESDASGWRLRIVWRWRATPVVQRSAAVYRRSTRGSTFRTASV